jgi:hypothetical protein
VLLDSKNETTFIQEDKDNPKEYKRKIRYFYDSIFFYWQVQIRQKNRRAVCENFGISFDIPRHKPREFVFNTNNH